MVWDAYHTPSGQGENPAKFVGEGESAENLDREGRRKGG
jgi:hypothetical protein